MRRRILGLVLLLSIFCCFAWTQPAQAKTAPIPTITITIVKNPVTKHMYFAPTYPRCITAPTINVKVINTTNSRATIQTDTGSILSVPPHATKYGHFVGYYIWIVWQILEPSYYGGNAQVFFNSCE